MSTSKFKISHIFLVFISLSLVCISLSISARGRGGRSWASYQIFKKGDLTGPPSLEGSCWEKGGWIFSGGVAIFKQKISINLEYLMTKRVYKQETLPCRNLRIQTGKILVKIWLLLKDKGWKMKNFNILGVHGKIRVLRGFQEKPIYRGGGIA